MPFERPKRRSLAANTPLLSAGVGNAGPVKPDFGGTTAQLYARYRRDLPTDRATALAGQIGLDPEDVVVDLGCGTGQLAVPLQPHCAAIIGIDPEPAMLAELRARGHRGCCACWAMIRFFHS